MGEEREPNGQFAKGHSGNVGNTRASYKTDMLAVIREAVTAEDWEAITHRAVTDARAGDKDARQWLANYTIGKLEENMPIALYPVSLDEWLARVEERTSL